MVGSFVKVREATRARKASTPLVIPLTPYLLIYLVFTRKAKSLDYTRILRHLIAPRFTRFFIGWKIQISLSMPRFIISMALPALRRNAYAKNCEEQLYFDQ